MSKQTMPNSPQKSERKSVAIKCRRRSRSRSRSRSSSSSSSSSSGSDCSRRHRRVKRHHKKEKKVVEVHEGLFKESASLSCPEGNLGPVHEYHLDDHGYTIPVLGFLKGQNGSPDTPMDLFAKKSCKANGLGLANTPENGVNQTVYIQFNITELWEDKDVDTFQLCFDLLDCNDIIEVYGSNCAGHLGKRLMKTDGKERKLQIALNDDSCCEKKHHHLCNFIAVTLHSRKCSDKLGFLVECMAMYHRKPPGYAFVHTDDQVSIPLGSPIPFRIASILRGFRQIDVYTLECLQRGVYGEIKTIDTLEPNSCALYINGVKAPGAWFGANATAQDIGQAVIKLNAGDQLQLINQSSQGGTVTLSPLGSGANNSVGQSTAAFSIWRVD